MTKSQQEIMRILLVEDNPGDRDLICDYIQESHGGHQISFAATLSEALRQADPCAIDVILLDLGLPDSQGIETLRRLRQELSDVPVIVITGMDDDAIGIKALKSGAQDYLVKGRTGPEVLNRALRYSVERHRLVEQLAHERKERERERENLALTGLQGPAQVTSRLYGGKSLHELAPRLFQDLSDEYGRLLIAALENQVKKTSRDISTELRDLADKIGAVSAGPRDVVEIHKSALRAITENKTPAKAQALTIEGRFLVLELMGHLVSFYRRHCMGVGFFTGQT